MKILVVSTNGIRKDGITSWLIQAFAALERTGIEVVDTVAYDTADESAIYRLMDMGVNVHILPTRKAQPYKYMCALRRLIRAERYDIVHVNGNSGTAALELLCCIGAGVKGRIVHSHNTRGMYPAIDKLLRPLMTALCTDRVACGRAAGKWLFAGKAFTVLPNGRSFADYAFDPDTRARVRTGLGLRDNDIAVGHVGNFYPQKNHRFLIEAFAAAFELNPRLHLYLIGDGALHQEVEMQVCDLALNEQVSFLGRSSEVPEYLSAFDVTVLPSLYEGFPNVVIEWQISGLPTLISTAVTDECRLTDLVSFVAAGDKAAWAQAIAAVTPVDRAGQSRRAQRLLKEAGYDAAGGSARLRALYLAIARREGISLTRSLPRMQK